MGSVGDVAQAYGPSTPGAGLWAGRRAPPGLGAWARTTGRAALSYQIRSKMIEAVIFFGLINVAFEFVVLSMVPPRMRLRLLGNVKWQRALHVTVMCFVLVVHWGTVTGTMSAFFSFCLSMVTVMIARAVFGYIENDVYHRRLIGYTVAELK